MKAGTLIGHASHGNLDGSDVVEFGGQENLVARKEEAAASSQALLAKVPLAESLEQEEEEEDERASTPPPPSLRTKPLAGASPSGVHNSIVRALLPTLEGRITKNRIGVGN
ncbi:hypothetical protein M407DRAFT_26935 [Tulasnella calospora MUT 4182]|uniref:Uncharacterized protein n=1 Tax=Tulasnella calospora MUT 4182 TaxID=1051891 RepID=A0A0C3Q457_9AGAM|nr:hypothetical protein M407DRAFT_26935 [Tulasnella calospora MUT 4182]